MKLGFRVKFDSFLMLTPMKPLSEGFLFKKKADEGNFTHYLVNLKKFMDIIVIRFGATFYFSITV